jgi:rhodanese-related sulfurtransferase
MQVRGALKFRGRRSLHQETGYYKTGHHWFDEKEISMPTLTSATTIVALSLVLSSAALAGDVSPVTVDGAATVDTAQARALFDQEAAFVDIRRDSDFEAGRIPGAIHIELKKKFNADSLEAEVSKDEPVVFYCNGHSCLRSSQASEMAVGWGFTKVHYYRDGFPAWKAAGNPVE